MPLSGLGRIAAAVRASSRIFLAFWALVVQTFLPVDDPAVALLLGPGLDARGVHARIGLGDAEGHHDLAACKIRGRYAPLHLFGAVPDDRLGGNT